MKNTPIKQEGSRRSFIKNLSLAAAGAYIVPKNFNSSCFNNADEVYTRYGCLFQTPDYLDSIQRMKAAGFDLIRSDLFLINQTSKRVIDLYLASGLSVQINVNWQPTTIPSEFPTNIPLLKEKAIAFFNHYAPYRNQLPFIVVGNEWDNLNYHVNSIDFYLAELYAITELAHQFGFKIADAALTGNSLQRWMYSQLSGLEAIEWKSNYFVGENNPNYQPLMQKIEHYADKVKNIPIDYLNVHWYNPFRCSNGFPKAAGAYLQYCNQSKLINNEFGIKIPSLNLWKQTIDEVSVYETNWGVQVTEYAIAYSGADVPGRAIRLTDEMLKELANPENTQQGILPESSMLLYPNPARNYFDVSPVNFVRTDNMIISVMDVHGLLITRQKIHGEYTQRITLPSNLKEGVYSVTIISGKQKAINQLIIQS